MEKDLTVGKPSTVLWKFCLPLFGSIVFQQLYNLADSFVAGKFGGENALAAVGNGYEVTLILIAFAFGCNIGGSVVAARLFGAKKNAEMKTAVYTTLIASFVLCAVLMVAGLFSCKALLRLIRTPAELMSDSAGYLYIYLYGLPFVFLYNVSSGIFAGLGDSRTPFLFLVCSSLANIGMDVAFAFAFGNVVSAVAWATFLCQGVACVLAVLCLILKLKKIPSEGRTKLFSGTLLKEIALIALPSILQQSFVSVGNIVIQGLVNSFGASVIAGYSAAVKLNSMMITSLTTLGNGISNYTSQNLGAEKPERVRSGFWAGLRLVWLVCVPFVLVYASAGKYLVAFFINEPTELAVETGKMFLLIVSPFYFVVAAKLVADGVLRGAKRMAKFMAATFIDLILRIGLAFALSVPFGATGIWLAWPIGWVIATALSILFYWLESRRLKAQERAAEETGECCRNNPSP